MTSIDNPPFLYPPGSPLMHPPLALRAARMYGFWVRGDSGKLQASVDATLNAAGAGRMRFQVLARYVLLTFTEVGHACSTCAEDRIKGWGRETDIVTWVLVARVEADHERPTAFYAYPLHIWVDDCMALVNGRELFGYPKYACEYTMPGVDDPATGFRLAARGFQPFAVDSELAMHRLLTVNAGDGSGCGQVSGDADNWRREMIRGLRDLEDFWIADSDWREGFESWFPLPALDQVFLKQFPDASGKRAVYQAVIAAPAQVESIESMYLLDGPYRLDLAPFASFPLDHTLGWALGVQPAYLGYRVDFDFVVGDGEVLVDNTVNGSGT